jgi:hypothetical protein
VEGTISEGIGVKGTICMRSISASTEEQWEEKWKTFQEKYDDQYPSIIIYLDMTLIQPHKEQLVKAGSTDTCIGITRQPLAARDFTTR